MESLTYRWEWPINARKAHIFRDDETLSLCRKWMFLGRQEGQGEVGPNFTKDDCVACIKAWRKEESIRASAESA